MSYEDRIPLQCYEFKSDMLRRQQISEVVPDIAIILEEDREYSFLDGIMYDLIIIEYFAYFK